jgi:hypothetical protein
VEKFSLCIFLGLFYVNLQTDIFLTNVINHLTFQINEPTRCNNFSSLLSRRFIYCSTCFGCPHAHHQKLNYNSSLWFYLRSVVVAVLLVVVWPVMGNRSVNTLRFPLTVTLTLIKFAFLAMKFPYEVCQ